MRLKGKELVEISKLQQQKSEFIMPHAGVSH